MDQEKLIIREAEGYALLEMFPEAWEAIESLRPAAWSSIAAMRVRMACAIEFRKWDMVETLADFLCDGGEDERALAASGYRALAFIATEDGNRAAAQDCINRAISMDPAIRQSFMEDPDFSTFFLRGS